MLRALILAMAILPLLWATAWTQDFTLQVEVTIEERPAVPAEGEEIYSSDLRFKVRTNQGSSFAQGKRVPIILDQENGQPVEWVELGTRVAFIGRPGPEGLTYTLEAEVTRLGDGPSVCRNRWEVDGVIQYATRTEVGRFQVGGDEGTQWVLSLTCRAVDEPGKVVDRQPPSADPDQSIRVQGIVMEEEGPARAILAVGGKTLEVEEGDLIPGQWRVLRIDSTGVVLQGPGGVRRTLAVRR